MVDQLDSIAHGDLVAEHLDPESAEVGEMGTVDFELTLDRTDESTVRDSALTVTPVISMTVISISAIVLLIFIVHHSVSPFGRTSPVNSPRNTTPALSKPIKAASTPARGNPKRSDNALAVTGPLTSSHPWTIFL